MIGAAGAAWPVAALADISNSPSTDGVTPTIVAGNPLDCAAAGIPGAATLTAGNGSGSTSDANGATVNVTSDGTTFSFTATLPGGDMILGVLAKGGSSGGNLYDYRTLAAGGVLSDGNLHPPPTGNGAQFAGLSHIVFCYGVATPHNNGGGGGNTGGGGTTTPPASTTTTTTTTTTTSTSGTSALKGVKKHKKHKRHHVRAKSISRPARHLPTFTG